MMFQNAFKFSFRNILKYGSYAVHTRKFIEHYPQTRRFENCGSNLKKYSQILSVSILGWLGFKSGDEEQESELIMTIKRSILLTQRNELAKAERMLHLALRLAQQQQNPDGILYVHDLLANLALERKEYDKAEKLFVFVMQWLLGHGVKQDDLKVIHISLKLARICHKQGEYDKAETGFRWCLDQIKSQKLTDPDAYILYGVIEDWYAQFLLDRGLVKESLFHLEEAYNVCVEVQGADSEKTVLLLNDLGTISSRAGDWEAAETYLKRATDMCGSDSEYLSIIYANLGLIEFERGFVEKATRHCKKAMYLSKKYDDDKAQQQAQRCLDRIQATSKNT